MINRNELRAECLTRLNEYRKRYTYDGLMAAILDDFNLGNEYLNKYFLVDHNVSDDQRAMEALLINSLLKLTLAERYEIVMDDLIGDALNKL